MKGAGGRVAKDLKRTGYRRRKGRKNRRAEKDRRERRRMGNLHLLSGNPAHPHTLLY